MPASGNVTRRPRRLCRGGLLTRAVAREVGHALEPDQVRQLQKRHGEVFHELLPDPRPLPGAVDLLRRLRELSVSFGIATSGRRPEINRSLEALRVPDTIPVIDRGDVLRAKPEPDLFLACQERLGDLPARSPIRKEVSHYGPACASEQKHTVWK